MTLLIVFLPNIEMKNKLNHAVEIFNRYFLADPGVINSQPASTPGLLKQASPAALRQAQDERDLLDVYGEFLLTVHAEPVEASFSLSPLSFSPYPRANPLTFYYHCLSKKITFGAKVL